MPDAASGAGERCRSDVLGSDRHRQFLTAFAACGGVRRELQVRRAGASASPCEDRLHVAFEDIRLADEGADEAVGRAVVDAPGVSMHSMRPRRITAMRSDITSASSWLCVTSSVLTFSSE